MSLPRIDSVDPVVIPAVPATEEKTYPDRYIAELHVTANVRQHRRNPTENPLVPSARAIMVPYNFDTSELGPPQPHVFEIQNLLEESARVPALAQLMGDLVGVVGNMSKEKTLRDKIEAEEDPAVIADLQTQLEAVETALGITP